MARLHLPRNEVVEYEPSIAEARVERRLVELGLPPLEDAQYSGNNRWLRYRRVSRRDDEVILGFSRDYSGRHFDSRPFHVGTGQGPLNPQRTEQGLRSAFPFYEEIRFGRYGRCNDYWVFYPDGAQSERTKLVIPCHDNPVVYGRILPEYGEPEELYGWAGDVERSELPGLVDDVLAYVRELYPDPVQAAEG